MKAPASWLREFAELPASATAEEIAARIGDVGFEVAGIEGDVIDFEITANRPDCLSIRGLAREAATAYQVQGPGAEVQGSGAEVQDPGSEVQDPGSEVQDPGSEVQATIESELCGRYALALADVTVGPSPTWLTDRLTACGIRPINNVVDITNYVLLETGQPMHAFDVARLSGSELRIRQARAGESLTTLDRQSRTLDPSMLVIADRERPVAIAGVMGGAASEVSASTTRIALESAWFAPESVRATSKRTGLKTEASTRFERGADPSAATTALARALDLLAQTGAGRRAGPTIDVCPMTLAERSITVTREYLDRLLGDQVPTDAVLRILTSLGFVTDSLTEGWNVRVPSWRVDVSRPADLVEEVGRHWGVNRVPATFPALRTPPQRSNAGVLRARRIRRLLCGAGLQEAVTFTFIEQAAAEPFAPEPSSLVAIANPLSEKFSVLRPSMLPGLLDALAYNRRRDIPNVRLFEAGAVFTMAGEESRAGWVMAGSRFSHWSQPEKDVDLYDAVGIADMLADAFGVTCHWEATEDTPCFAPGRAAALFMEHEHGVTRFGTVGQLRPSLVEARGLPAGTTVVAGELNVSVVPPAAATIQRVTPLPRHPAVIRDLSILIDASLPAASVRGTIRAQAPSTLVHVREFDRYEGKGVPEGQVSLSLRLTFRDPNRTLTDGEIQQAVDAIVSALADTHGATLRGLQN